jgi:hypothetical protein
MYLWTSFLDIFHLGASICFCATCIYHLLFILDTRKWQEAINYHHFVLRCPIGQKLEKKSKRIKNYKEIEIHRKKTLTGMEFLFNKAQSNWFFSYTMMTASTSTNTTTATTSLPLHWQTILILVVYTLVQQMCRLNRKYPPTTLAQVFT